MSNLHLNNLPTATFSHPNVGTLTVQTGLDDAEWGYNMNARTFPTYGGEVIQILSIYIDDLKLQGTCATYHQIEEIYRYFAEYMIIASQGSSPTPGIGDSTTSSAYNLQPVVFSYPHRDWHFQLYPRSAPGFKYSSDTVTPIWMLDSFVIDEISDDLALIRSGIESAALQKGGAGLPFDGTVAQGMQGTFTLMGEISPIYGNPDANPWQTWTQDVQAAEKIIDKYANFYASLLPAYEQGDFKSLYAALGTPNLSQPTSPTTKTSSTGSTGTNTGTGGGGSGTAVQQGATNFGSGGGGLLP